MATIRPSAVAGSFYPGNQQVLARELETLLGAATQVKSQAHPKAIIVPHAGYIYSGSIAATAYAHLVHNYESIKRVILLGPAHRVPVRGLALPDVDIFSTPLGEVEIDQEAVESISHLNQVVLSRAAHSQEHSLEVQLPFLQTVLGNFKLVPLVVGDASPAEVAEVLNILWGGPETLIVISSDLSHYLPYNIAQSVDRDTIQHILSMESPITHLQACGGTPINGLVLAAKHHKIKPKLLAMCNSGDTGGDKTRVVGYASLMFTEQNCDE
jgi:MEMO1 family protein